jgi:hypothetical protein
MPKTNKELKKIIRDAEKVLESSSRPVAAGKMKISKEALRAAKAFNKYKELTGKKKLSDIEKRALLKYTPRQVVKESTLKQSAYEKRLKAFRELMNRDIQPGEYADLRYLTARQLQKRIGTYESEVSDARGDGDKSEADAFPDVFKDVDFPSVRWWDIPSIIRSSAEERRAGGLLYENAGIFWDDPDKISLSRLFFEGIDGRQWSIIMALRSILVANGYSDILISPDESRDRFAVYREEWNGVEELSPDYKTTRRYRKKS